MAHYKMHRSNITIADTDDGVFLRLNQNTGVHLNVSDRVTTSSMLDEKSKPITFTVTDGPLKHPEPGAVLNEAVTTDLGWFLVSRETNDMK